MANFDKPSVRRLLDEQSWLLPMDSPMEEEQVQRSRSRFKQRHARLGKSQQRTGQSAGVDHPHAGYQTGGAIPKPRLNMFWFKPFFGFRMR